MRLTFFVQIFFVLTCFVISGLRADAAQAAHEPKVDQSADLQTDLQNLQVVSTQHAKVPLIICFLEKESKKTAAIVDRLARDLAFSDQVAVTIKTVSNKPVKQDIKKLCADGYPLALFITAGKKKSVEWRLFDTMQGEMIEGKEYIKRGDSIDGWAHNIADSLWPLLTGQEPFFSSKIAYCKQVNNNITHNKHDKQARRIKQVCIADYDGNNSQVIVDVPTVTIAPRWNNDIGYPLLFYSEYTNTNIRLMSVDMSKKRRIASNYDGINMLPSFSHDGKKVVYCASHGDGHCQLYYGQQGRFKKITNNKGNNISPTLSGNGSRIVFCSDFQTGRPQVYIYDVESGAIERVTSGGYCASPSYCSKRNLIAYGKMIKGEMQLYLYDEKKKTHTCLTHDAGSKEEYAWSPCGNYLLFSIEDKGMSRIAMLHVLTKQRRYVTPIGEHCSYPAWSPLYAQYPHV